jgi:hypothetical protein
VPRWVKLLLKVVGVLVVLVVALLGVGYWMLTHPGIYSEKLGGAWELRKPQSLTIGSGNPPDFLERVHGKTRITVAERPYPYRYLGDDCMLFTVWSRGEYEVRAACGDRQPIVVARPPNGMDARDLEHDPATIDDKPYPWADLKRHALLVQDF